MDAIDQDLLRGLDLIRSIERCVLTKSIDYARLKHIYDQQNDAAALRDAGLITDLELSRRCVALRRDLSAEENDIIAGMWLQSVIGKILPDAVLEDATRRKSLGTSSRDVRSWAMMTTCKGSCLI